MFANLFLELDRKERPMLGRVLIREDEKEENKGNIGALGKNERGRRTRR